MTQSFSTEYRVSTGEVISFANQNYIIGSVYTLEFEEKTGPLKKVGDVISHVNLGCGLKLDEGDEKCETSAKISITNEEAYHDPSPATAVTVACGIKCSADGIEVTEKKIWFSSCGLFLGTSVEDDSISYNADVPCRSTNAQLAQTPIQTEAAP